MRLIVRRTGFALLALLSIQICGYAAYKYGFRPLGEGMHPAMRASFQSHPWAIYLHVFGAIAALAIGPFQFLGRLRARLPGLHRMLGRIYLGVGVLVGGLAGLYVALHAFGGWPTRLGFALLALAWLYTGARAYRAIRGGDPRSHRQWMIRNFALTFAAVTLRLMIPAALVSGLRFSDAYPFIAWLCWVPNLVVVELYLARDTPTTLNSVAPA